MGILNCVHTRMSKCLWNQVQKNCLHFLEDQLIFRDHIHTEGIDILFRTIPLYTWTYMSVSFNFANPTSI